MGTSFLPAPLCCQPGFCPPPAQLQLPELGRGMLPVLEALAHGGRLRSAGREAGGMLWKSGCQRAIPATSQLPGLRGAAAHLRPEVARRLITGVSLFLEQGLRPPAGEKQGEAQRGCLSGWGSLCPRALPGPGSPCPGSAARRFNGGGCADSEGPGDVATGRWGRQRETRQAGRGASRRGHEWGRPWDQGRSGAGADVCVWGGKHAPGPGRLLTSAARLSSLGARLPLHLLRLPAARSPACSPARSCRRFATCSLQ